MWFINFVLGSAVAVTLLVLGASTYVDHTAAAMKANSVADVVPLPRAAPGRAKVQKAAVEDEVVHEPKPSKAIKVRHRRSDGGRRATW